MSSPLGAPGAKLTLFVSATMSLVGIVGVSRSLGALSLDAGELDPVAISPDAAFNAALAAVQEGLLLAPAARALAVANLLLSALLVVASFRLTARAATAFWWAKQALWANAIYCLVSVCVHVWLFEAHPPLVAAVDALAEANARLAGASGAPADAPPAVFRFAALLGTTAYQPVLGAVLLGLLRLTRREDVRRFVLREV